MTTSISGWARIWAAVAAVLTVLLGISVAQAAAGGAGAGDDASAGAPGASASGASAATISVTLSEFAIEPAALTAPAGQPLTFTVSNEGSVPHDFSIEGVAKTEEIPAGESATLEVEALDAGEYVVICTVAGHEPAGMTGTLTVTEGAAAVPVADSGDAGSGGDHGDHASLTPEQMVQLHDEGVAAFPADTVGEGNQPLEPTVEADGTKVFTLVADEIEWEVEPGVVKEGLAFNEMVPGPRIDVTVGDDVRIDVVNEMEVPTALHLHGMILPNAMDGVPGLTQSAILPGETFSYEFTVRNAGSHMYHSHFDSANQVPSGLLGAFVSHEPDEPIDDVDVDEVMILNDGPLGYTINGKGFPATQPIVVQRGEKVRVRYMNEGLQVHPMHLHGIPQQVVAKDGYPLPQPHMEDTVLVAPGERIDVIVDATEPGAWAFHCHILNHAEGPEGMFGMVTALIVEE